MRIDNFRVLASSLFPQGIGGKKGGVNPRHYICFEYTDNIEVINQFYLLVGGGLYVTFFVESVVLVDVEILGGAVGGVFIWTFGLLTGVFQSKKQKGIVKQF